MPMPTTVAQVTYAGRSVTEAASLAMACQTPGVSNTCAMTLTGGSPSTQRIDSDTVQLPITPAAAGLIHDLDHDRHYAHLRTQARDRNRVLVEPPRDGTQSCFII